MDKSPQDSRELKKLIPPPISRKKSLDRKAFLIIAVSIILVVAGIAIRGIANQKSLNHTIQALIKVDEQVWVALPTELLRIDQQTQHVEHLSYQRMQLPSPITYAVKTANHYWLQLFSGQVWMCPQNSLSCHQISALSDGENHYYNIAHLPAKNQIIAVNNFSAKIMALDADTGRIVTPDIHYSVPPLDISNPRIQLLMNTAGSLDGWQHGKLYRSNRLHVINNMLVQTDTGNKRVIAWPLNKDGEPQWQTPVNIIHSAHKQPYDIAYISRQNKKYNQWLTLEAGSILNQGKLRSYAEQNNTASTEIPISLSDPTLMTTYNS